MGEIGYLRNEHATAPISLIQGAGKFSWIKP